MYSSAWVTLLHLALLISGSFAAPRRLPSHSKGQGKSHHKVLDNGVVVLAKSYRKYGHKVPQSVGDTLKATHGVETNEKAAAVAGSAISSSSKVAQSGRGTGVGQVASYPANEGAEYLVPVTIGGQTLQMNLDTGSSDLWIFSTALDSHERGNHTLYDPTHSRSHQQVPEAMFAVSYGDDTALTGHVGADTVAIGGVTVAAQAVAMPTSFSSGIIDDPSDGIVGLGFQKMNSICSKGAPAPNAANDACPDGHGPNPRPTWFENARAALAQGVFAANLKMGTKGGYTFGKIDEDAFEGKLTWVKVDSSKGFWQVGSSGYRVGGKKGIDDDGEVVKYEGEDGIVDSGSSLLMLQPEVVAAYYRGVKGARKDETGWTYPCGTKLPDFGLGLGKGKAEYVADIPGAVIDYAPTSNPKGESFNPPIHHSLIPFI